MNILPFATSFLGRDIPERISVCCFLLFVLGLASSQVASFDIFWQLQSGQFMLENQAFIYQDTFSLASEEFRYEHCWLHDIIFFLIYSLGGYPLMSMFKGALVMGAATLLVNSARQRQASWMAILLLGPPLFLQTQTFWSDRPQLWSFLFASAFLLLLEKYRRQGGYSLWLLLPLQLFWVNLHAGAVLAFPLIVAYLVGSLFDRWFKISEYRSGEWRQFAFILVGLVFVSMITPYGWQPLQVLITAPSLGEASGEAIQMFNWDWRSIDLRRFPQYAYSMAGVAGLILLGWRRFSFVDLLLLGGLGYMGFSLERHTPFWFFAAWVVAPRYLDAFLAWGWFERHLRAVLSWRMAGIGLFLACLFWFGKPVYDIRGWFQTGLLGWQYPVAAAEFVQKHDLPGNLFHDYTSGGYLMWQLFPAYKVFWDGRQDSKEMFQLGLHVIKGLHGWDRVLQQHQVATVVTAALSPVSGQHYLLIDHLRRHPGWSLVFADSSFLVFVRDDKVDQRWLEGHRLPNVRIDDTRLAAAELYVQRLPVRPGAYWTMAQVRLERRQYPEAFKALVQYLSRIPTPDPLAVQYYQMLWPSFGQDADGKRGR